MSTSAPATPLRFAIIGCGLIGKKRLASLLPDSLALAFDLDRSRAEALVKIAGCGAVGQSLEATVQSPEVDVVIVATINSSLFSIAQVAVASGKHVLIEKPAALSASEISEIMAVTTRSLVRVGYNHRYHPALLKARQIVDADAIGELMFIRARYGHGGRVGYDREWRADPKLSGGGELIDQGVHLIDLAGWFLGDFTTVEGHAATYYWDMPVDDNAFMSLRNAEGKTAWLQVSCSEWKNMFSFEIYGRTGKLQIDGLGGSYGVERLTYYKMLPEMGPPETTIWEYPRGDQSWHLEMEAFLEDIRLQRTPVPGLEEARSALQVVGQIYRRSGYPVF